ncbi:MAG: leucine-rich repeat domain-containing protein [Bacteroidales bacterium]
MKTILCVLLLALATLPAFSQNNTFVNQYLDLRKDAAAGEINTLTISGKSYLQQIKDSIAPDCPPDERKKIAYLLQQIETVTLVGDCNFPDSSRASGLEIQQLIDRQEALLSYHHGNAMNVRLLTDGGENIQDFTVIFGVGEPFALFSDSLDTSKMGVVAIDVNSKLSVSISGTPIELEGPSVCAIVNMRFKKPITPDDFNLLIKNTLTDNKENKGEHLFAAKAIKARKEPVAFSVMHNGKELFFKGDQAIVLTQENPQGSKAFPSQISGTILIAPPNGSKYRGDIVIPSHVSHNGITYPVVTIGASAFQESAVTSVVLPEGVRAIALLAFDNCENLKTVHLPNSLTSIGLAAFQGCKKLERITLPPHLFHIDGFAFSGCFALNSVTLPESVTHLGEYAFALCSIKEFHFPELQTLASGILSNCKELERVTLPAAVTKIDESVLFNNPALKQITIQATEPPALEKVFFWSKEQVTVNVPAASIEKYQQAPVWKELHLAVN